MNIQNILDALVSQAKQERFVSKSIRTLGETMLLLESMPAAAPVKLDFTDENIDDVASYRGYYEDLAITHTVKDRSVNATEFLGMLRRAVGRTFGGYKGGKYTMSRKTLVWVARYGETGRMLTDVKEIGGTVVIVTQEDEE